MSAAHNKETEKLVFHRRKICSGREHRRGIKTYYCSRAPRHIQIHPARKVWEKALHSESGTVALNIKSFDASLPTLESHVSAKYTRSRLIQISHTVFECGQQIFSPFENIQQMPVRSNIFLPKTHSKGEKIKFLFLQQV